MRYPLPKDPYIVTGVIFIAIIVFGNRLWGWEKFEYGFILLLYLVITLGIRLDDILKHIETTNEKLDRLLEPTETPSEEVPSPNQDPDISRQLNELTRSLKAVNSSLKQILDTIKPPDAP